SLDGPPDVTVYPSEVDGARRLLATEKPTHLVAIERPGRNRAGDYLNMRGDSVAEWNAPIDELFLCSGDREAGLDRGWAEKGATRPRSRGQPTRRVPRRRGVARPVPVRVGARGRRMGM